MHRSLWKACSVPLLVLACAGTETDNPAAPEGIELVRSPLAYVRNSQVADADFERLQQGHRAFALELYQMLRQGLEPDQNLMVSPLCVSMLMAMTQAGARGGTADQIALALHFDQTLEALHPSMNQLSQRLMGGVDQQKAKLTLLNSLWMSQVVAERDRIGREFLDTLSTQYDAGLFLADFEGEPEQTRRAINDWIGQNTEGLIPELFDSSSIDSGTSLVLSSTIYFGAPWEYPFDPETTEDRPFTLPSGDQLTVPMMGRTYQYPFVLDTDWSAAELPYANSSLSMILVLPNEGAFDTFEAGMDAVLVEEIARALNDARQVDELLALALPRFSFDTSIDLIPPLQGLGIVDAFSANEADFSGMMKDGGLYVETALQKTSIAVDENGTVAAAASGEVLVPMGISPTLTFDRPFVFFIYDRGSESLLFVGRVANPLQ